MNLVGRLFIQTLKVLYYYYYYYYIKNNFFSERLATEKDFFCQNFTFRQRLYRDLPL